MTLNILRHSEGFIPKNLFQYAIKKMLKRVQHDKQFPVTLNCLGFCFTKSRYSLLFAVVRLTFCSFVSALSLRTTQNPLVSGAILKDTSLRSVWRKRCRHTEALAEVSFFCKGNPRQQRPKNLFCDDCIDYIHFNPVKHGYVKLAKDWQYSTFLRYVKQGFYDENWCDFSQDRDLYE